MTNNAWDRSEKAAEHLRAALVELSGAMAEHDYPDLGDESKASIAGALGDVAGALSRLP